MHSNIIDIKTTVTQIKRHIQNHTMRQNKQLMQKNNVAYMH